jgi:hypothetical protein
MIDIDRPELPKNYAAMRLVTHFPDTGLRKATGLDFGAIRQLPVQLTQPAASSLLLKQLRMMLQVPEYELTVLQVGQRIAALWPYSIVPLLTAPCVSWSSNTWPSTVLP